MRPRDFPDFFDREPPPGQSRESRIRLDAEGRFWDGGGLVSHSRLKAAFASWLTRHPDNGRYILENGYDWVYIEVEDTPYFVKSLRGSPSELTLIFSDGREEEAPLSGWRVRTDGSVTVLVRDGAYEARLLPGAQAELGPWLEETDGQFSLSFGDEFVRIEPSPNGDP